MAKQDDSKETRQYRISNGPITSSSLTPNIADLAEIAFPAPSEVPSLFAIARDPRTLFACWSVDWLIVFKDCGMPADRRAHLRLLSQSSSNTIAVEPTVGSCIIPDLNPGETYAVELGYYAPADSWHLVATGNEVMMPFASEPAGDDVEMATIPLHLTFESMVNLLENARPQRLARTLAQIQERAARSGELSGPEHELLRALKLSAEDVHKQAIYRDSLAKSEKVRDRSEALAEAIGASPGRGFGASSPSAASGAGS